MESLAETRAKILNELVEDDPQVRSEFLKRYGTQAQTIAKNLARAVLSWRELQAVAGEDERRSYLSFLTLSTLTLQTQSAKLFLSGHMIAAGNLFRQAIENAALALVCSGARLTVLDRFLADKYSTNDAVRDVVRHAAVLGLKAEGVAALKEAQEFYHRFSHPTKLTLAAIMSFSEEGLYIGASYDEGKREAYDKEIVGRIGFSNVSLGIVEAVKANMAQWR